MKTAAIYCRVSTEDQEREGTSLQTQPEACLKYCQDKGYDVAYRFSELSRLNTRRFYGGTYLTEKKGDTNGCIDKRSNVTDYGWRA